MVIQQFSAPDYTFTGNHLAFIRTYLQLNEKDFAKLLEKSTKEIAALESSAEQPLNLNTKIENILKQRLQKQFSINNQQNDLLSKQSIFSSHKRPPESNDKKLDDKPSKKPKK